MGKIYQCMLTVWIHTSWGNCPGAIRVFDDMINYDSSLWSLQKEQVQKKDLKYCFILIASEERKKPKKIPRSAADKSSEKSLGRTLILMWHVTRQERVCCSPESCSGFCEVTGTSGEGAAEEVPSLPSNSSGTQPKATWPLREVWTCQVVSFSWSQMFP